MNREQIETERLILRRPLPADAREIFDRYASDAEVVKYMSWPRHRTIDDTRAFLAFSDAEWETSPAGPFLIRARDSGTLLGSTGYAFEAPGVAVTGYVLARDSWGRGYATEALRAIVDRAGVIGVRRLYARCHAEHRASAHVMEKCGFRFEALLPAHDEFPNLAPGEKLDVLEYGIELR